jgi:hypothetical protein
LPSETEYVVALVLRLFATAASRASSPLGCAIRCIHLPVIRSLPACRCSQMPLATAFPHSPPLPRNRCPAFHGDNGIFGETCRPNYSLPDNAEPSRISEPEFEDPFSLFDSFGTFTVTSQSCKKHIPGGEWQYNMKTLKISTVLVLTLLTCSSCSHFGGHATSPMGNSGVAPYNGPTNNKELSHVLWNSKNPHILALDARTKQSLIDNLVFENGKPVTQTATDAQILGSSNSSSKEIYSAIFNCPVLSFQDENRPVLVTISRGDFVKLQKSDPVTYSATSALSHCDNCRYSSPQLGTCCDVGGKGCWDAIVISNGKYYIVK